MANGPDGHINPSGPDRDTGLAPSSFSPRAPGRFRGHGSPITCPLASGRGPGKGAWPPTKERPRHRTLALVILAAAAPAYAALPSPHFDSGTEGWKIVDVDFYSGGNPPMITD